MPEVMAAVGMQETPDSLMHFMISYLYGFILLVFPMVYSIIRANGLMAKYLEQGSLAAFCFLCSVSANDTKQCLTVSAGICALMYVLQMLANMGDKLANLRYFTVFTLFDANELVANTPDYTGSLSLFLAAIVLFLSSIWVFKKRELQV